MRSLIMSHPRTTSIESAMFSPRTPAAELYPQQATYKLEPSPGVHPFAKHTALTPVAFPPFDCKPRRDPSARGVPCPRPKRACPRHVGPKKSGAKQSRAKHTAGNAGNSPKHLRPPPHLRAAHPAQPGEHLPLLKRRPGPRLLAKSRRLRAPRGARHGTKAACRHRNRHLHQQQPRHPNRTLGATRPEHLPQRFPRAHQLRRRPPRPPHCPRRSRPRTLHRRLRPRFRRSRIRRIRQIRQQNHKTRNPRRRHPPPNPPRHPARPQRRPAQTAHPLPLHDPRPLGRPHLLGHVERRRHLRHRPVVPPHVPSTTTFAAGTPSPTSAAEFYLEYGHFDYFLTVPSRT